ncbi:TetR/AcrR family transcriptional regulator [Pararhizobium sp.]|uniref:TetR/AcrR family transcriptional regulator n=1 Tax=Pararhizobium sp. TaxID=1977563 RepID=UPI0027169693|nr:TetR/AcrR family transcriptional regulator C-terminal ligand-binding domain-containing protein [Pararhizobium sp.]MDO9416311.1 TetR/AcrR family transcriptional regulator C-terminal ligand-binding domain-containing protein [Pararhizobium sp.]
MNNREKIRPGGRSARVQTSIHAATRDLLVAMDRSDLTIPLIAAKAGVTPSTIYRRWGDLPALLADVAVERLRPDAPPLDTGNARSDLDAWAEQYAEEMASEPGRAMIRDVLSGKADTPNPGKCCAFTRQQLEVIVERAATRGELFPDVDLLMDHVVAPIMYRILFDDAPGAAQVRAFVERLMGEVRQGFCAPQLAAPPERKRAVAE